MYDTDWFYKGSSMIFACFRMLARPVFMLFFAVALSACSLFSTDSKREEAVQLNISAQAVTDLNPDIKSRPSPMIVRVYELKSDAVFNQVRRPAHPQIGAIGVLAAFRDLPRSTWRATFILLPPADIPWYKKMWSSNAIRLRVLLEDNAVRILDE